MNDQVAQPNGSARLLEDLRVLNRLLVRANRELSRSQQLLRTTISEVQEESRREDGPENEQQGGRDDH